MKLNITLDNYADPSFTNRTKRGLINGLGQLTRMLFGTAMDEDVEDLRERYNHLASLAANQNKAIDMNSLHIVAAARTAAAERSCLRHVYASSKLAARSKD